MPRRRWTKDIIIAEILSFPPGERYSTHIKGIQEPLWKAAVRHFGSWGSAITACGLDYEKVVQHGPRQPPANKSNKKCILASCNSKHHAKGYCHVHYNIMRNSNKG